MYVVYSTVTGNDCIKFLFRQRSFQEKRWNERHSRAYFETLMTLLKVQFLCEIELIIKICEIMTATTNGGNLRQCKGRFYITEEQILAFASTPNMVREGKNLSLNFKQIA